MHLIFMRRKRFPQESLLTLPPPPPPPPRDHPLQQGLLSGSKTGGYEQVPADADCES